MKAILLIALGLLLGYGITFIAAFAGIGNGLRLATIGTKCSSGLERWNSVGLVGGDSGCFCDDFSSPAMALYCNADSNHHLGYSQRFRVRSV